MVGTSKILTVSYGTFSCTLEGFDDSFNTMKAIAEYFRDLASDDRYFGAEPPTPDAEMLAKIAEREILRRVDASMDESGIVLRATALTDQSGDKVHDAASRAEVEAARKAAKAAKKAQKKAAKAEVKNLSDAEKAKARKDAREQSHAESQAAEDARDTEADTSETSLLESVSAATAAQTEGTADSAVEETCDDAPSSMLAAKESAPENTPDTMPDAVAEPVEKAKVPPHPDVESVAAKLQRIRAVVGRSGTPEPDHIADLTEQFLPQTQSPDVADVEDSTQDQPGDHDDRAAETADAPQTDVAEVEDEAAEPQAGVDNDDMISRVMAQNAQADAPTVEAATDDLATTEMPQADAPIAQTGEPRARVVRMKRADFEKAVADGKVDAEDDTEEDAPTGPDFGLLDGADDLDDYLEDSDFTDDAMSDFDDDDLAEDLKAIREEAVQDAAETVKDSVETANISEPEATETPEDTAAFIAEEPDVDDAALDRLMSETDAQMLEPAGSRRRDAIAQLKAAVAAKEAARQVGEPDDDDQDVENAFRNDLSEAVRPEGAARPRHVVRGETRTERPRPAPLKLVAAQRVDLEQAVAQRDGPVVPRRVATRKEEPVSRASGSFAEFADNMGATQLPDLLEAAAAYTSFVEGADEFSRPQILRRVRSVAADDFKREDELRGFAALITAGRFTKVRNGRFQVASDSRFNPERRAG